MNRFIFAIWILLGASFAHATGGSGAGNGGNVICDISRGFHENCRLYDFEEWGLTNFDFLKSLDFEGRNFKAEDRKLGLQKNILFYDPRYWIDFSPWSKGGDEAGIGGAFVLTKRRKGSLPTHMSMAVIDSPNRRRFDAFNQLLYGELSCEKSSADEYYGRFPSELRHFCSIGVLVLNKLYEIRTIDEDFAKTIEDRIFKLKWLFVNATLMPSHDIGHTTISANRPNLALRYKDVVRLSVWLYGQSQWATRVGIFFHEAIYDLTEDQGDLDSERARQITALLFKGDPSGNSIREAARLFREKK